MAAPRAVDRVGWRPAMIAAAVSLVTMPLTAVWFLALGGALLVAGAAPMALGRRAGPTPLAGIALGLLVGPAVYLGMALAI